MSDNEHLLLTYRAIKALRDNEPDPKTRAELTDALMLLSDLEWRDVNEELPVSPVMVFTASKRRKNARRMYAQGYYDGKWHHGALGKVTHWLPIPPLREGDYD